MVTDNSEMLMKALMSKLYKTITGGEAEGIKIPRNKFVSWLLPGFPMSTIDFSFASDGLVGNTAEETKLRYHKAWALSKLVDFVPDLPPENNGNNDFIDNAGGGMGQVVHATTQDAISEVWNDVLKYSKVVNIEISDKEKEKLENFRQKMVVTKEVVDLVTDEKKQVTQPSPLTIAYNTKMNDYITAADDYMNLLIDAQAAKGDSSEAIRRVTAWANKSKFLRDKMDAAYNAWISEGYKNEYEEMNAYINQVTERSMVLYKEALKREYENSLMSSPAEAGAGDFRYTSVVPADFATTPGWTEFKWYDQDYDAHFDSHTSSWSAKGSVSFGLFSFGGSASHSKTEVNSNFKSTGFSASLEFTQIPIIRPWFKPGFFWNRGWTLDQLWDMQYDKRVSDGEQRPQGRLIAYSTSALFVRNVHFAFAEADAMSHYVDEKTSAGGSVGYGPFSLGGSYSTGDTSGDNHAHMEGGELVIKGMQLIGYINNLIPKAPNPNPNIKPEQFVGGA